MKLLAAQDLATTTPAVLREAPHRPLAPARRKSLLHRYAVIAAGRLAALCDPLGAQEMRAALRCE